MQDKLTEKEILSIEAFCSNEEMFEAVKKVLLSGIYSHGVIQKGLKHNPLVNGALSLVSLSTNNPIPDDQLGQHIRGVWSGLNALENSYKELKNIKSNKEGEVVSPYNEAI